jgi:hypothetical protein
VFGDRQKQTVKALKKDEEGVTHTSTDNVKAKSENGLDRLFYSLK